MADCLSLDLRRRVAAFVEAGHSRRAAGRRFRVAESAAIKLVRRVAATGSCAPARQGRPKDTGKLAPNTAFLLGMVEATPDITKSLKPWPQLTATCHCFVNGAATSRSVMGRRSRWRRRRMSDLAVGASADVEADDVALALAGAVLMTATSADPSQLRRLLDLLLDGLRPSR